MTKLEARIVKVLKSQKKGMGKKDLAKKLGLGRTRREEFAQALTSLVAQHVLLEKNNRYILVESLGLSRAQIVKVTGTFGFAKPLPEGNKDVFIPGRKLMGSMPGDIVLIRQARGQGELPEGEVYEILEQADTPFSGVFTRDLDGDFVVPDRYVRFPIRVDAKSKIPARPGDKVLASLTGRAERHSGLTAVITETFGSASRASSCCRSILAANGIQPEFPPEVMEQAKSIQAGDGIHAKELAQRTDLRHETIFTIDGADSKDLDDAVSLRQLPDGWELGVHIADVSYYVPHKSPLDAEAYVRGTSVYYADSVVPMLPKELSNGICSLNPGEDRLAFSAFVQLDMDGHIQSYRFEKSVIRSLVKGVYSEVNALLDGTADHSIHAKYAGLEDTIAQMRALADILMKNRYGRGGMDLDSVETKILLHPDGTVRDIVPRERGVSERIIEEFMLTANDAAASFALSLETPFVYRVHESPSPDKLETLYAVLDTLGVKHPKSKTGVTPGSIAKILDDTRGSDLAPVINTMVLRTMAKAKYAPDNIGHFGLALKNYTHFTSPIRRYPDLVIHRILSAHVTGMKPDNIRKRFGKFVTEASAHSTEREIAAMTAERDCEDCYKAEFMARFIGDTFDGVITSCTAFGVYVRLENTAEGLVRLADFPDGDWAYDNVVSFKDSVSGRSIRIGDAVRVTIAGTDVSAGQIDMTLEGGVIL
ncbi:ribonuclease R [Ruminococcaceae bacterium OttesenSCG-928-L11]|nr:ribonuclease R [Ruminococcaceae bacterium OttesenSCG-928-L11]